MSASPPPIPRPVQQASPATKWKILLWISVAGIILPPFSALVEIFGFVIEALDQLGMTGSGDPEALAKGITISFMRVLGGLVVSVIFIPFLILSIVCLRKSNQSLR